MHGRAQGFVFSFLAGVEVKGLWFGSLELFGIFFMVRVGGADLGFAVFRFEGLSSGDSLLGFMAYGFKLYGCCGFMG